MASYPRRPFPSIGGRAVTGFRVTVRVGGMDRALTKLARFASPREVHAALQAGMLHAARDVATGAKDRARYSSGKMRRAIQHEALPGALPAARAFAPPIDGKPYPFWQHQGTGVHGPRGAPIVPLTKKWLRFKTKDGQVVFAKSVRGVTPNRFLTDALPAVRPRVKEYCKQELRKLLDTQGGRPRG